MSKKYLHVPLILNLDRRDILELGYVRVVDKSEIPIGKMKKISVQGKEILVANINGNFYAIGNVCTHEHGDLSQGTLEGNIVTCPKHKSKFDVTTGSRFATKNEAVSPEDSR